MRILLVDDDEPLMEALASNLIEQHYAVDIATDGEMGWEFICLFNYDLVVLDLMLPKLDGISLCRRLRSEGYNMPILLLSGRNTSTDKVKGLDAGADDYVVKPFNLEELIARIRALLRRESHDLSPILHWDGLSLNPKTCEVKYQEKLLHLTPKEYSLLELFLRHPQQVFSPGAIIDNIWSFSDPPGEEAVRTHIKGLRQKLKAVGLAKAAIETVYGLGYRLKSPQEEPENQASIATSEGKKRKNLETEAAIAQAWLQFRDVAYERLAILENLTRALNESRESKELQQLARATAHKLGGSLGSFGFTEGSKIAKKIEKLLETTLIYESDRIQKLRELVENLRRELENQSLEKAARWQLDQNILLLIMDEESELTQQLAVTAAAWGMQTAIACTLSQIKDFLQQKSPAVVLISLSFPQDNRLQLLQAIQHQMPSLPIIAIIEKGDFKDRLELIHQGVNLILEYPVTAVQVIETVTQVLQNSGSGAKILIVDDDPQVLVALKIALEPWNFQITTLNQSPQLWQLLEEVKPDLLILDVEMPEINGIEICQLLRSAPRWQQLPVLFLTVHQDEKTEHQAFAIGADDYITKPVVGAELANRILNRLLRSRQTRQ
jgi:DNA-binding response OmpR family regulator